MQAGVRPGAREIGAIASCVDNLQTTHPVDQRRRGVWLYGGRAGSVEVVVQPHHVYVGRVRRLLDHRDGQWRRAVAGQPYIH